jgi:hypothetical protein
MRHIEAIRAVPILAALLAVQLPAQQRPDFTGVWKLRTDRPRYSEIWNVTQTDREITIRMSIADDQLSDRVLIFTTEFDGKEHKQTVIGTPASVSASWADEGLRLSIQREARPGLLLHNRRVLLLSPDRKRIESKLVQESPPPRVERDEVFDRQ